MSLWNAALLGLLQGLTEFLPVSSSGHLALAQMTLVHFGHPFSQPGVVFDAMLHVGTAAAVVWCERQHLKRWLTTTSGARLLGLMVVATLVTGVVGLALRRVATDAFHQAALIGLFLMITGAVLLATRALGSGTTDEAGTSFRQVAVMGLAQGLAVFPGLSRSGFTIAAGLGVGLDRAWVARLSFLLSVPAIAGATVLEVADAARSLEAIPPGFWLACLVGAVAAALSGVVALRLVIAAVSARSFHRFAWYCLPLGLVVIAVALAGP